MKISLFFIWDKLATLMYTKALQLEAKIKCYNQQKSTNGRLTSTCETIKMFDSQNKNN